MNDMGFGGARDFDAELQELSARVAAMEAIAAEMTVMPGTIAAIDLERGRAELNVVRQAIEQLGQVADKRVEALDGISDRLRGIAVTLESALYMGGVNGAEGRTVFELKQALETALSR